MDTDKLVPLEVAIRELELVKQRTEQQNQINKKLNSQQFDRGTQPSERGSAFNDGMASAYAKVKTNGNKMKNDMVHATTSSPYRKESTSKPKYKRVSRSSNIIEGVFNEKPPMPTHDTYTNNNKQNKLNENLRWGVKPLPQPKGNSRWGL